MAAITIEVDLPEGVAAPPAPGTPFTIFVPALLVPVKGHDVLLRALALPGPADAGMRAVLAGGGPLGTPLQQLAARLGIAERVDFLGQLPHREVLMRLRSGDLSHYVAVPLASG